MTKQEKIPPNIICKCGGIAILYETDRKAKGKLWTVYRCFNGCGADTYTNPREISVSDDIGSLFG